MKKLSLLFIFLFLFYATNISAATLTIQTTGVEDATIRAGTNSGTNYGTITSIEAKEEGSGNNWRRAVLSFDFSSLPAGVTIKSATLEAKTFDATTSEGDSVDVKRLTRTDWVEAEVTWDDYKSGSAWTGAGGDYTEDDKATSAVPTNETFQLWTVTAQVQYARDNTSDIMHCIIIITTVNFIGYYSTEHATEANRPKLTIVYGRSQVVKLDTLLNYNDVPYYLLSP